MQASLTAVHSGSFALECVRQSIGVCPAFGGGPTQHSQWPHSSRLAYLNVHVRTILTLICLALLSGAVTHR